MGSCMRLCCCMSCCVESATYVHDRYSSWKWKHDERFETQPLGLPPPPPRNRTIEAAVIDKNTSEIKRLAAENHAAIDIVNSLGETPLHLACKLGYLHIVDELLDQGADPNKLTSIGTPIHCALKAVKTGYIKEEDGVCLIKKLSSKGCDIEAVDKGLKTALFCAAELEQLECMRTLLQLGAFVNCVEANNFSPLYMSVIQGDLDCVNLLLSQVGNIQVDHRDSAGRTSLLASVIIIHNNIKSEIPGNSSSDTLQKFKRIAITEALLWAGADPDQRDNYERVALDVVFNILEADKIHRLYRNQPRDTFAENKTSSDDASESVFVVLLRLLVFCGADLSPFKSQVHKYFVEVPSWLEAVMKQQGPNDEYGAELVSFLSERPFKLAHRCRMVVRAHLASINKLHRVQQLPLPQGLKDYLAIMHL